MATKVKLVADGVVTADQLTLTTASTGTNTTAPATTAFVQQEVAALVDSSPDALNTLNELAAALGDDANFSTTVTNSIATKLPLAGGTLTGALTVSATTATVNITGGSSGASLINFGDSDDGNVGRIYYDHTDNFMQFKAGDAERMRIDSTGNVGIGDISPSAKLEIKQGSSNWYEGIRINRSDNATQFGTFSNNSGATFIGATDTTGGSNNAILFGNSTNGTTYSERMRIDSTGNLLVGQQTASSGTVGTSLRADGRTFFCADGNYAAHFNRNTSDGAIAHFAKDDNIVGSIGSYFGAMYIGTPTGTDGYIRLGQAELVPATSAGANRDNYMDLGASGGRFKDLYLSGGVRGTSTIDITVPETAGAAIKLEFGNNVNDTRRTVQAYKDNFEPAAADTGVIGLGQATNKWKDLYLSGTAYIDTKLITKTTSGEVIRFERASDSFRYSSITHHSTDAGGAFISFKVHDGVTATSQADVLHLLGNGHVGIGETSPGSQLQITSNTAGVNAILTVKNAQNNRESRIQLLDESNGGGLVLNYDNGGNEAYIKNNVNGALGIYLGGTGAANALDDYEEGTWTPACGATLSLAVGKYTKIGNQVTVYYHLVTTGGLPTSTAQVIITGLPFTSNSGSLVAAPIYSRYYTPNDSSLTSLVQDSESQIRLMNINDQNFDYTIWGELEASANNSVYMIGSATYMV